MSYLGPIACPNCDSPINDDALVCPYCHSTAPASAPWNAGSLELTAVLAVLLGSIWAIDHWSGTQYLKTLVAMFSSNS
jgi:hypothetical protein